MKAIIESPKMQIAIAIAEQKRIFNIINPKKKTNIKSFDTTLIKCGIN